MDKDLPEQPIKVYRRANKPAVKWLFKNKQGASSNLQGSEFDLLIVYNKGRIEHQTAGYNGGTGDGALVVDLDEGSVTWNYTPDETKVIPGNGARYELARVIAGNRRPWIGGDVQMKGYF